MESVNRAVDSAEEDHICPNSRRLWPSECLAIVTTRKSPVELAALHIQANQFIAESHAEYVVAESHHINRQAHTVGYPLRNGIFPTHLACGYLKGINMPYS